MVAQELSNDPSADSVPTGNNTDFHGGDMAANGAHNAGPAYHSQPGGVPGGTGHGPMQPPGEVAAGDLSARPRFEFDSDALRNFYPDEARDNNISGVRVRLRITVDASGRITRVQALNDPGYGIARAAERAVRNVFQATAPLDRAGHPVTSTVEYNLTFELE